MSNVPAIIPQNLPAHLAAGAAQFLHMNDDAAGGISAGSIPSIGIKGSRFHIKGMSDEPILVVDPVSKFPVQFLDVVLIGANPKVSKKYYAGTFDEDAAPTEPDCQSQNGETPDPDVKSKQSNACATCPMAAWGSKITESGKESKACADGKRLVVIPPSDMAHKALALDVTPASLKDYAAYVRGLTSKGIPMTAVVTRLSFDPTVAYPKLVFQYNRFLTEQEFAVAMDRAKSDEVTSIIAPRRITIPLAQIPAALPAHLAPPPAAPAAPQFAPPPQFAPAPSAPPPVAPAAPQAAPAGTISFGAPPPQATAFNTTPAASVESVAAQAAETAETAKRGRGRPKATPAVAAPAASVAPPPPAAPAGVDPRWYTIDAGFHQAIQAAGGFDSPGGAAMYNALPKLAAAAPVVAPVAAPVAPTPPVSPAPSFAAAPQVVAQTGDLGASLDAMLAQAMGTKV